MRKIISANEVLSEEEMDRYIKVLKEEFPKLWDAYISNIKTMNLINEFLTAMNVDEDTERKES